MILESIMRCHVERCQCGALERDLGINVWYSWSQLKTGWPSWAKATIMRRSAVEHFIWCEAIGYFINHIRSEMVLLFLPIVLLAHWLSVINWFCIGFLFATVVGSGICNQWMVLCFVGTPPCKVTFHVYASASWDFIQGICSTLQPGWDLLHVVMGMGQVRMVFRLCMLICTMAAILIDK